METKEVKDALHASKAKVNAKNAQIANYEKVIERIEQASKMGLEEVVLFGLGLNLDGVKKLMDLGYSVTTIVHPMEQIKMYKVSW